MFPSFGSFTMRPTFQLFGAVSVCQMISRISIRSLGVCTSLAFSISVLAWSFPGAIPILRSLMAYFTSSTVGTSVSMLRVSTPSPISATVVGHSWLSTLSKRFIPTGKLVFCTGGEFSILFSHWCNCVSKFSTQSFCNAV